MNRIMLFLGFLFLVVPCNSQTAEQYFKEANAKHKLQDFDGALLNYSKAIELYPKFSEAYYNRGLTK